MLLDQANVGNRWILSASIGLACCFALVRVQMGLSLQDEAYYAVAPVSWIQSWPEETGNQSIHQFSGCITYPFIRAYAWVIPDLTGIILTLRLLYFFGSIAVSFAIHMFFKPVVGVPNSIFLALIMFFFIPYGLPAPSYNTIGSQMGIAALALLSTALRASVTVGVNGNRIFPILLLSAACMSLSIIAYPVLVGMFAFTFLCTLAFMRNSRSLAITWAVMVAIVCIVMGICAVMWLGGPTRIIQMLEFAGSFETTLNLSGKIMTGISQLASNEIYGALIIAGFISGWTHAFSIGRLGSGIRLLWVAGTVYWCLFTKYPPVLFSRTHDLVLLLVVNSAPQAFMALFSSDLTQKLVATLYFSSLAGAFLVSYTATHVLFSFSVIGIGAAVAGMTLRIGSVPSNRLRLESLGLGKYTLLFGYLSFILVYGENWPNEPMRNRITTGPFAGLLATDRSRHLLEKGVEAIQAIPPWCKSVEVIGPSGYYLLTHLELRSSFPFPLVDHLSKKTYPLLEKWYDNPAHLADSVVLVSPEAMRTRETNLFQTEFVKNHFRIMAKTESGITVFVNPAREP